MMTSNILILILLPIFVAIIILLSFVIFEKRKNRKSIILLSQIDNKTIIEKQSSKKVTDDFMFKLIQSGITYKEYNEARFLFVIIGFIVMFSIPILFEDFLVNLLAISIGLICVIYGGKIYLMISKAERVEKINRDLGVFLDLVNVILEAGGSLKNAFFEVSRRGHGIIDKELLKEVSILEYEMTNYSTKVAYENMKNRIDSREVDKIVDFLILSEETGIGVKNIFTMQSDEMRRERFYKIKGKVNTLNMYIMLVIFLFVMPAFGMFVIFPMMAGKLDFGF